MECECRVEDSKAQDNEEYQTPQQCKKANVVVKVLRRRKKEEDMMKS
jgi:hypothetical protein